MHSSVGNDSESVRQLLREVYDELRKIASVTMDRMPGNHTLQTTALVHEAWLNLEDKAPTHWQSRAHYIATAAETMRHILVDQARRRRAVRHGGGLERVDIDQVEVPNSAESDKLFIEIRDAIENISADHPDVAKLLTLIYVGGFSMTEAACILGMTRGTAHRRWLYATSLLYDEIRPSKVGRLASCEGEQQRDSKHASRC